MQCHPDRLNFKDTSAIGVTKKQMNKIYFMFNQQPAIIKQLFNMMTTFV